jgi:hypothetical protein
MNKNLPHFTSHDPPMFTFLVSCYTTCDLRCSCEIQTNIGSKVCFITSYIFITNCSYQLKVFNFKYSLVFKQKKLNKNFIKILNA